MASASPLVLQLGNGETKPVYLLGDELARGADATIHNLAGLPQAAVAKLYHAHRLDPERPAKLRAMMIDPPNLPPVEHRGESFLQVAWPIGLLYRGDQCVGYAMPMVQLKRAASLDALLSGKTRRALGLSSSYRFAVQTAHSLAFAVAELHAHGYRLIDLKPANVSVYKDLPQVVMLDCDGYSVAASGACAGYPAHQFTADYIAPEAWQGKLRPEQLGLQQDNFALAVIVFQLLNRGLHPFQGVPGKGMRPVNSNQERIAAGWYAYGQRMSPEIKPSPWSIHGHLPADLRARFDQAFTTLLRPSATDWADVLAGYAEPETERLIDCAKHPDHAVFAGQQCGHCAIEKQRRQSEKLAMRPKAKQQARQLQTPKPQTVFSINSVLQRNRNPHGIATRGSPRRFPASSRQAPTQARKKPWYRRRRTRAPRSMNTNQGKDLLTVFFLLFLFALAWLVLTTVY